MSIQENNIQFERVIRVESHFERVKALPRCVSNLGHRKPSKEGSSLPAITPHYSRCVEYGQDGFYYIITLSLALIIRACVEYC